MSKPGGTRDEEQSWEAQGGVAKQGVRDTKQVPEKQRQGEIEEGSESEVVDEHSWEFCNPELKVFK